MATNNRLEKIKQKFYSFLKQKKPIAGLAIVNGAIYATIIGDLSAGKAGNKNILTEKIILKSLSSQDIADGLKQLRGKLGTEFSSVILSFSSANAYSSIFEFPLNAEESQIEEAMAIATSTLPIKTDDVYIDWMPLENAKSKKREIILGMARKNIINDYLNIFESNKISIVAAETHSWSIGQLLEDGDDIILMITEEQDNIVFSVFDGKVPYFQFDLLKANFQSEEELLQSLTHYTNRIIHFVRAENSQTRKVNSIIIIAKENIENYLKENIKGIEFKDKKNIVGDILKTLPAGMAELGNLAALGAAKRGVIPRRFDKLISFLPIGTELAYEYHRLFSFIDFVQKLLIGFAIFLIIIFAGTLVMAKSSYLNIEKSLQKEAAFPSEIALTREKAQQFNDKVSQISILYSKIPIWENIFKEIDKYAGFGISISQISASEDGSVSFTGTASTRDALISLKNKLAESTFIESDQLPISLFLNKENINFSIRGRLKDINILYLSI